MVNETYKPAFRFAFASWFILAAMVIMLSHYLHGCSAPQKALEKTVVHITDAVCTVISLETSTGVVRDVCVYEHEIEPLINAILAARASKAAAGRPLAP